MCVVSMVGDTFRDRWDRQIFPSFNPNIPPAPIGPVPKADPIFVSTITREEFDALKREVELFKELLIRAKIYDEKNNEPNCEMEEKIAFLKHAAKLVGVDLEEVFGK